MSDEQMELLAEIKQEPEQLQEDCSISTQVKVEPSFDNDRTANNAIVHVTRSKTRSSSKVNTPTGYTTTNNVLTDEDIIDPAVTSSQNASIPTSDSESIHKFYIGPGSTTNRRNNFTKKIQCTDTTKQILGFKIMKNILNGESFPNEVSTTSREPVHITSIQPVHTTETEDRSEPVHITSIQPVQLTDTEASSEPVHITSIQPVQLTDTEASSEPVHITSIQPVQLTDTEASSEPFHITSIQPVHTTETEDRSEPVHITSIQPVHTTDIDTLRTASIVPVSIASTETNSDTTSTSTGYTILKSVLNNEPVAINTGIFQQQLANLKLPIPRLNPSTSNTSIKEKKTPEDSEAPKDFACGVCGKMFRHASNLRTHMMIHSGQKPYSCSKCEKTFSDESNRRRHELTHEVQDRPFACTICDKTYSRSHHLDRHMQTHKEDRPFACEVCDKTFKFRSHLFEHTKIHTGEKTLQCEFCSLSFSRKYQLQVHRRTHTGEKPHMCIICGRSFAIGSALKSHMCLHTGEKFYKCVCGKAYSRKGHLQKHVQVAHTNNETGQMYCVVCSETFDQNLELIKHMQESHKDIVNSENKSSNDLIASNIFKILKSNSNLLKDASNYEEVTKTITERLGLTPDQLEFSNIRGTIKRKMEVDSGVSKQQHNDVGSTEGDKHDDNDNAGVDGASDEDPETIDENLTDSNMSSDNIDDQNCNVQESSENCPNDEEISMEQESRSKDIKVEASDTINQSCPENTDQDNDNVDSTSMLPDETGEDGSLKDMLNQIEKKWEFINYTEEDMEDGKLFDLDPEEEYEDLASMGPHVCRLCGMRFTNWEFMQEHLYAHIDKLERFISKTKSKLRDGSNITNDADEEEKRFVCGICGMGFLTQARLNKHLRKHTGEKRVKCDICDKRLVDAHALRKHQRVHTGEKPYTCDICGKKFAQSSNLHTHIRVHHSGSVK